MFRFTLHVLMLMLMSPVKTELRRIDNISRTSVVGVGSVKKNITISFQVTKDPVFMCSVQLRSCYACE